MRIVIARQSNTRSVFVIYNDQDQLVGRLNKPRFVTGDEAYSLAVQFADKHPKLFPGRQEKQSRFDETFIQGK